MEESDKKEIFNSAEDEYIFQEKKAKLFVTKLENFSNDLEDWINNEEINYLMITLDSINKLRKHLKFIYNNSKTLHATVRSYILR
jgi:hypothetical protein